MSDDSDTASEDEDYEYGADSKESEMGGRSDDESEASQEPRETSEIMKIILIGEEAEKAAEEERRANEKAAEEESRANEKATKEAAGVDQDQWKFMCSKCGNFLSDTNAENPPLECTKFKRSKHTSVTTMTGRQIRTCCKRYHFKCSPEFLQDAADAPPGQPPKSIDVLIPNRKRWKCSDCRAAPKGNDNNVDVDDDPEDEDEN